MCLEGQHVDDLTAAPTGSDPDADEMNLGVQITGVFPGTACSVYRFQEWPAGAGPSRLALPRCRARLA